MKANLVKTLIFTGIIIRLVLSVTTYHRDLAAYTTSAEFILFQGKFFSFYDAVLENRGLSLEFVYQPLAYLIPSLFYLPFYPIIQATVEGLRHTNPYLLSGKSVLPVLLIYKLPFLLADLAILKFIPELFKTKKQKNLSKILWALNPVAIYVSSVLGQIDIVLTFFLVMSLLSLKRKNYQYTGFFIALSALTKPITLILFPLLAIHLWYKTNSLKQTIITLLPGILTLIVVITPFLRSPGYKATFNAYHLSKSTYASIDIAPGTTIPFFYLFYAITLIMFIKNKLSLSKAFFLSIFASLAFTHFHVQWFVWLTPWLVIFGSEDSKENWLIYLATIASWLIILFSFNADVHLKTWLTLFNSNLKFSISDFPQLITFILLSRAWIGGLYLTNFLKKK